MSIKNIGGVPLDWDENNERNLFESLFRQSSTISSSESQQEFPETISTLREISNEIALESPFGKESIFYRKEREVMYGKISKS